MNIYLLTDSEFHNEPSVHTGLNDVLEALISCEGDGEGSIAAIMLDTDTNKITQLGFCVDGELDIRVGGST